MLLNLNIYHVRVSAAAMPSQRFKAGLGLVLFALLTSNLLGQDPMLSCGDLGYVRRVGLFMRFYGSIQAVSLVHAHQTRFGQNPNLVQTRAYGKAPAKPKHAII